MVQNAVVGEFKKKLELCILETFYTGNTQLWNYLKKESAPYTCINIIKVFSVCCIHLLVKSMCNDISPFLSLNDVDRIL